MALTLTITLDDEAIETYLAVINDGENEPVTVDMLNQNPELQADLAEVVKVNFLDGLYEAYDEIFE